MVLVNGTSGTSVSPKVGAAGQRIGLSRDAPSVDHLAPTPRPGWDRRPTTGLLTSCCCPHGRGTGLALGDAR